MKKFLFLLIIAVSVIISCNDDKNQPDPPNTDQPAPKADTTTKVETLPVN